MKFGVAIFPGSNCDEDIINVLQNVLSVEVHRLWHKNSVPANFTTKDCIILPGGFSYGDYLRSGAIARFSPIMQSIIVHAQNGGKVLGICNGFQILCETGLLPGALLRNENQLFICKNTFITPVTLRSDITSQLEMHKAYKIPIAHAEGRFFTDPETLQQLKNNDQILFRYSNAKGELDAKENPNGSLDFIAGICNAQRNVFGMMPHPERAAESILRNTDGLLILSGLLKNALIEL